MWIYDSPILLYFHKIIENHPLVVKERNLENILLNQINSTCQSFSSSYYKETVNLYSTNTLLVKNKS